MPKLINQTQYNQACEALKALDLTASMFCLQTRAMDIVESLDDLDQFEPGATLQDVINCWGDLAYEDFVSELKEAWALIE
jgi:hypothetical protein